MITGIVLISIPPGTYRDSHTSQTTNHQSTAMIQMDQPVPQI